MMQNTAAVVSDAPKYPHPKHSLWAKILIYIGCASLLICGTVTLIFAFIPFSALSHVFLGFYLAFFGLVVVMTEFRLPFAMRAFGFLGTKFGLGIFFIFAGTLGLSFGVGKSVGVLVPFISGIFWCLVGILCITDSAIQGKSSQATVSAVEGV